MNTTQDIEISAVIPVFNEEENLPLLVPRLVDILKEIGLSHEIIFVDDGSSDGSRRVLKEFSSRYPSVRVLRFRENRGLSSALWAGTKEARGSKIVTLDSDLQNDPADIPRLMKYLDRYDMATGWRQRREDPWLKRVSSKIGNFIRNWLSGESIKDSACTLRFFKKECVENIPVFNGMHRFLSTLVKREGYRVVEVPVAHHPRRFGKSKYNIRNRMWRSFVDLLAVRWMKSRRIQYDIEERF
ncbi:MAG: glycosyltransferase family 2 protein [Thermodesulfobacteriota bacterium]